MDPLIHLIAAESSTGARLCEPLRACPWTPSPGGPGWARGASGCLGRSRGGHRRRAVSEERRGESDPHPSHRPSRRRADGSGDRVVPATDSAPVHRRRPRRRYRGALDGAQWPGWARVRTDGARRVNHGSHAGRQLAHGAHGRPLQRGCHGRTRSSLQVSVKTIVSSFVRAGSGGEGTTSIPRQNHVTQELTPRSHHGRATGS